MTMSITVNGETRPLCALSVADFLVRQGLDPRRKGIAVAINGQVIARERWSEVRLQANDQVEIVKPYSGG